MGAEGAFETNDGQAPAAVKFLAHDRGNTLFLTPTNAMWRFPGREARMEFVGADKSAHMTGVNPLGSHSNYFIGRDPKMWRTNIANYGKVRCQNVYPGIDVVYKRTQHELEFDFVIYPGANPESIQLRFESVDRPLLDRGDVVAGDIRIRKPFAYQARGGRRTPVVADFILTQNDRVTLKVGAYDHARLLTIDPLVYSTYLGGSGNDVPFGMAIDASGNVYVTGSTTSTDFPTTAGAVGRSDAGPLDAFVTKLDSTGSVVLYSTYLGGIGVERGSAVAVDAAGDAYVTGYTDSSDFPTTAGALNRTVRGSDAFVVKLNPSGSSLLYSTLLGGSQHDDSRNIAIDAAGNAYITGETWSPDFPTSIGAIATSIVGSADAYITKLNPTGSAVVYSTLLGGSGFDQPWGLAVDSADNAFIAGLTESPNFPTTPGAFRTIFGGPSNDAFVAKVNSSGTALLYSTYLGGSSTDQAFGLAIDRAGNAYVTGYTSSADFPTTASAFDTTFGGAVDAFVTKLNASGSAALYSTYLGGTLGDFGNAIAVDGFGDAYVAGSTGSTEFPTTANAFSTTINGLGDAFLVKFNAAGSALLYSTFIGGSIGDTAYALALDDSGNAYIAGASGSDNFPTTPGAFSRKFSGPFGLSDIFVAKIIPGGRRRVVRGH